MSYEYTCTGCGHTRFNDMITIIPSHTPLPNYTDCILRCNTCNGPIMSSYMIDVRINTDYRIRYIEPMSNNKQ